eukprot:jgi/Mesvir1/24731/Mv26007-RA.1
MPRPEVQPSLSDLLLHMHRMPVLHAAPSGKHKHKHKLIEAAPVASTSGPPALQHAAQVVSLKVSERLAWCRVAQGQTGACYGMCDYTELSCTAVQVSLPKISGPCWVSCQESAWSHAPAQRADASTLQTWRVCTR